MSDTIYDDGRYVVSTSIVATPTRFYPVFNTTAGIRHPPANGVRDCPAPG